MLDVLGTLSLTSRFSRRPSLIKMLLLSTTAVLAHTLTASAPVPTGSSANAHRTDLAELFNNEKARATERLAQAEAVQGRLSALGAVRDLWPLPPRLQPHDIPVVTLDRSLTAEALDALLSHECCAVHVRGFIEDDVCKSIAARLSTSSAASSGEQRGGDFFSNWNIHQAQSSTVFTKTEVDKVGVTSGEALDSLDDFCEYLDPTSPVSLNALLPGALNPFTELRAALDDLHPQGCRLRQLGGWTLPPGTFRRMYSSKGLIHADTATLLSRAGGEFSANLYIRTPPGEGALSVYPAQQYAADAADGAGAPITSPALLGDLQSLARRQALGFDQAGQAELRAALPLKRTIDVGDGDLVLINTGRFHNVEPFDSAFRLSGQCWLSFQRDKALRMWV